MSRICQNEVCYCDGSCYRPNDHTGLVPKEIPNTPEENAMRLLGWVCPNCGAGMSPFAQRCGCKDTPFRVTC